MMKKKMTAGILILAMAAGVLSACGSSGNSTATSSATAEASSDAGAAVTESVSEEADTTDQTADGSGNTLVVYYSAQGHTEPFAQAIADELGGDLFEIVPEEVYTDDDLNWTDADSRVSREHEDESLRDVPLVTTEVENWDSYDTVYIGYPIWWGIAAWPVNNFVTDNDFTGKTVIPFCTSSSSGIGQSGELLEEMAGSGTWLEGERFQSNQDTDDAREWAASLSK